MELASLVAQEGIWTASKLIAAPISALLFISALIGFIPDSVSRTRFFIALVALVVGWQTVSVSYEHLSEWQVPVVFIGVMLVVALVLDRVALLHVLVARFTNVMRSIAVSYKGLLWTIVAVMVMACIYLFL
jgi:hypothetical protein